jgi:hypothetical protein
MLSDKNDKPVTVRRRPTADEVAQAAASAGASAMAKARWARVPAEERRRQMRLLSAQRVDPRGGRPRERLRCWCGARSLHSARQRAFDCCKRAGAWPC